MLQKTESFKHQDAMDYYGTGHHQHDKMRKQASKHVNEVAEIRATLMAECYIGFQKLLNEELKAFDLKDSIFFDTLKNNNAGFTAGGSGSLPKKTGGSGGLIDPDVKITQIGNQFSENILS